MVMLTYNHEKNNKSIRSMIEQLDENDEIIIISDNPKTNFQYVKKGNDYGISDGINKVRNIAKTSIYIQKR